MATNDATIIATRLTSDELEKSINDLVSKVDRAMGAMAKSVDNAIGSMKNSFGQLAKNTRDSATAAKELAMGYDSVADSLTKAMSKGIGTFGGFGTKQVLESEKQALLDFNRTYHESVEKARSEQDRLNKIAEIGRLSAQQSMRPRERWDVLQDSEINRLRMTIHGLESDLKRLDNLSLRQAQQQFSEYDALIKQARSEIEKLKQTPITDPNQRTALIQQIRDYENEIKRLQAEQNKINPLSFNSEARGRLTQELQAAKNEVRQMGQALIDADNEEKKLAQDSRVQTAEMQKQARAAKEIATLKKEFDSAMAMPIAKGTSAELADTQDKLKELEIIISKLKGTDIIPPERIKLAEQEVERLRNEVSRLFALNPSTGNTLFGQGRATMSGSGKMSFGDYENLRAAIASVLRLQQEEVMIYDTETAAAKNLKKTLNQLTTAYNSLNSAERNSIQGQNLADQIQRTSRALREIQNQMNRPVSLKSALGLDENTLEQISYKIKQLDSYMRGLDINKSKDVINQVTQAMNRLKQKQTEILGENARLTSSNNALARSFNYMKNRLAFYFTIGASTQFVKTLIDIRSQYEMTERSLGILINSAERGSQIFNELSQMALVSPYTLIELSSAAKQLVAYDVAAKDVVNTTRRLADMAAAVGIPMERLTYALGQIKSYGYLNARDNRMFANAGIPLVKQLADYYTQLEGRMVSTADVYDRIKNKAVGYNDVMQVINRMTDEGGKFFDFQAKMAGTLKVQLANLTLAWNNMLNDIGKSNQSLLTVPIAGLKNLFLQWQSINRILTTLLITLGSAKAAQLLFNLAMGEGTIKALKEAAAIETSSVETYKNILSKNKLSRAQAKFLISTNQSNLALRGAIYQMKILSLEEIKAAASARGFSALWIRTWTGAATVLQGAIRGLKMIGTSMLSMVTNPAFLAITAMSAITDLVLQAKQQAEAIRELNGELKENAKTAADSISKFRNENQKLALSSASLAETEKAWEAIKGELESSALSANQFMAELSAIEDISKRTKDAFDYARRIEEAQFALSRLDETALRVNQDIAWGALGEGLAEDLEDYKEAVEEKKKIDDEFNRTFSLGNWEKNLQLELDEANSEIEKFAVNAIRVIEQTLGPEGIQDKIKVGEAIKRISQIMKLKNPEISGAAEVLFDVKLDQIFARRFGEAYDKTTNLWTMLMEEIKGKYSSAFQDITESVYDETNKWTPAQTQAINKAVEHLRNTLPVEFHSILNEMVADLNSRDFRIHIGYTFDVPKLDELTKDFNTQFIGIGVLNNKEIKKRQERYSRYNKKEGETTLQWQKRLKDERKQENDLLEQKNQIISRTTGIVKKNAETEKISIQERISAIDEVAKHEGFDVFESKKGGGGRSRGNKGAKPEDEVAKALKDELSIIKEMQSNYDKLRKAGVDTTTALDIASSGYEETLNRINAILTKYGISKFKASDFVGKDISDPNTLLEALQKQRNTLLKSGKIKLSSLKDLDVEIQRLNVDVKVYNMKKVTDGLNNELGKIKEEYELAVELDANPELGDMFASAFGLDTSSYPKTAQEAIDRMQEATDKAIAEHTFGEGIDIDVNDLMHPFDILRDDIEKWSKETGVTLDSGLVSSIKNAQKDARDLFSKDAKQTIQDWQKLLEKYAEYETRRSEIQKQAEREREIARKKGASQEIIDAINLRERRSLAQLDFEEFQKSPDWVLATGNLASLSNRAIMMLIDSLEKYKKSARNLDPKQIEKINKALRNLRKEARKNNPFSALADSMDEAKANADLFEPEIENVDKKIQDLLNNYDNLSDEEKERLKELIKLYQHLIELQDKASKPAFIQTMQDIGKYLDKAKVATEGFKSVAESIGDEGLIKVAEAADDIVGNLQAAEKGAETWGGWWGAIIGGVTDMIPKLAKWISGDNDITKKVQEIQIEAKRLEIAYKRLEHAVENSMGTAETQARRATIANKELQLAEKQRELDLEKSRKSKNQDKDKIIQLEGEIQDLEFEIENLAKGVADSLLGSDIKSAAEDFVDTWVSAWKEGEKTIDAMNEKVDEMIYNLVKKAATSAIVGKIIKPLYDAVDQYTSDASAGGAELTMSELKALSELASTLGVKIDTALGAFYNNLEAQNIISKGAASSNLSALQQGIQGITEDTAGALEAYMNIVSQQVFLHSDLLTQIRDAVVMMSGDVQLATQAQMLLQLQQSYSVQMAIQAILEGWTNANGMAVRVELTN